jgi:methylsterol monooxygenase
VIYPSIWVAQPLFKYVGVSTRAEDIPTLVTFLWQMAVCFLVEDTWHYFLHWAFHRYKVLYNNIHVVHHRWSAPIGLAAQFAHPLEILGLGFGTFLGILILQPHVLVMWAWISLRQMEAVVVHSGYDFPFAPEYWLPWYAGTAFHDHHHQYNTGNYASTGLFWDSVFGTSSRYDRLQELKKKKKKAGAKAE